MNKVIGVDIDNTIVNSNYYWAQWCVHESGMYEDFASRISLYEEAVQFYDVSKVFTRFFPKERALDFWRADDLYDNMKPIFLAQKNLFILHKLGYKIVFVSALKGNHHKSKVNFMKQYFPFYDGFIGTKEKEFAKVDVMIDDNYEILNRFTDPNISLIYYDHGYIDHFNAKFKRPVIHCQNWNSILTQIQKL